MHLSTVLWPLATETLDPRHTTLWHCVSVGPGESRFAAGDEVYGDISGHGFVAYAEYVCIKQEALFSKPAEMSFDEAAAIPHATMLAVRGKIVCVIHGPHSMKDAPGLLRRFGEGKH